MKKILFLHQRGIDGRNPFSYAARLAKGSHAELLILHTFTFEVDDNITEARYKQLLQRRWVEVVNEVMGLKNFYLTERDKQERDINLKFGYRIIYGQLKTELFKILHDETIDLLVYPHPRENNQDTELTDKLMRTIFDSDLAPVLVIPEEQPFMLVNKILYTTDFHSANNRIAVLAYVKQLAALFDSGINFLHVSRNSEITQYKNTDEYNLIQEILNTDKRHRLEIISGDSVLRTISDYVVDQQINLVIVIKRNKNLIEALFKQSFTNQITFRSREPILVLHE